MDPRRLREETRAEHEATEAVMPLQDEQLTMSTYVRTLRILLDITSSWEQWSASSAPENFRELLLARLRSHLIEKDLEVLGARICAEAAGAIDWTAIVGSQDPGTARFQAGFLGALYVIEGSTLGGRYIARNVETALGLVPGEGNAYFIGHGEETGSMWRQITAQIAGVPERFDRDLVEAARRAFQAFRHALTTSQVVQKVAHG